MRSIAAGDRTSKRGRLRPSADVLGAGHCVPPAGSSRCRPANVSSCRLNPGSRHRSAVDDARCGGRARQPAAAASPSEQLAGKRDRADRVLAVAVRADLRRPALAGRGAADDHLDPLAQPGGRERLDDGPLAGHGGGQQRRHADDVRVVLPGGLDEPVGRHVDAEVVDLEAAGGEHHADEVLADLVDVALDRADHDATDHVALGGLALPAPAPGRPSPSASRAQRASCPAGTARPGRTARRRRTARGPARCRSRPAAAPRPRAPAPRGRRRPPRHRR